MKLSTKARAAIPKKEFGIPSKAPGSGSYPMPDAAHAANAKSRAKAQYNKGAMGQGALNQIFAHANSVLGKGKK